MSVARLQLEELMREEEARAAAERKALERDAQLLPKNTGRLHHEATVRRDCAREVARWWRDLREMNGTVTGAKIAALLRKLRRMEGT